MTLSREWRTFFLLFGASLIACAGILFYLPTYRDLILLYLYSIPSNSVIPIPHEPAMVYFGRLHEPLLVALVACAGTMVPCFLDYQAIHFAFQAERLQKVRRSDVYQGAVTYFLKAPFISVTIAAFAPFIPFYVFRVLSPTSGYPLRRYMLAMAVGRLPRYYFFALLGEALPLPDLIPALLLILVVCIALFLLVKRHLASRRAVLDDAGASAAAVPDTPTQPPTAAS